MNWEDAKKDLSARGFAVSEMTSERDPTLKVVAGFTTVGEIEIARAFCFLAERDGEYSVGNGSSFQIETTSLSVAVSAATSYMLRELDKLSLSDHE